MCDHLSCSNARLKITEYSSTIEPHSNLPSTPDRLTWAQYRLGGRPSLMHVGQAIIPALSHPGVEQSAVGSCAVSSRADMAAWTEMPTATRASRCRRPALGREAAKKTYKKNLWRWKWWWGHVIMHHMRKCGIPARLPCVVHGVGWITRVRLSRCGGHSPCTSATA